MQQADTDNGSPQSEFNSKNGSTRREFLGQLTLAGAACTVAPLVAKAVPADMENVMDLPNRQIMTVAIIINGKKRTLSVDPRVTLLDALRENLAMTGTKKGCDRGQCGACTVLVNGRRVNSCLTLAAMCNNKEVTTIEGLAKGDNLHPMQEAFIRHDAFQCGYCTPGQICSAIGLVNEGHAKTVADIHEQMSGNICRCGAYRNIVNAIKEVANI